MAQWGNGTEHTGPLSVEGVGEFPDDGLCDCATGWDMNLEWANGVTMNFTDGKRNKLGVLSGLHSRFHPAIRETIQRVLDGQIGQIVSIEENFIRGPYGRTGRPKGMRELEA